MLAGCGDASVRSDHSNTAEMARRLAEQERAHAHDMARESATRASTEADLQALQLVAIGLGVALVLLVLLAARERRARRILERLLRLLLDRIGRSREPPKTDPDP